MVFILQQSYAQLLTVFQCLILIEIMGTKPLEIVQLVYPTVFASSKFLCLNSGISCNFIFIISQLVKQKYLFQVLTFPNGQNFKESRDF